MDESCPNCGAPERIVLPVWDGQDPPQNGEHPDLIACKECRRVIDPLEYAIEDTEPLPQIPLSEREKSSLPMGNQNTDTPTIFEWMTVKGAAARYGVTDWASHADSTLTMSENIAIMKRVGAGTTLRKMRYEP